MIEVNTAILCASLSTLKPLLNPRLLRKAIFDRRACAGFTLASDVAESLSPRNEFGRGSKFISEQYIFTSAQMVREDPTSPATELSVCEVALVSPAPALVKQEFSSGERYSKASWRNSRF